MKKATTSDSHRSVFRPFLIILVIMALLQLPTVNLLAREVSLGDLEPQVVDPDGDAVPPGCPSTITVNGGDYVGSCRVNPNASVILERGTGWRTEQFGLVFRVLASTVHEYEVYALSSSTWYPVVSYGAQFDSDTGSADDLLAADGTFILGRDIFAGDAYTAIRLDFGNTFPSQSTVIYGGVNTIDDPADYYDDIWTDLEPGESRMAFVYRDAGDYEYCNKSDYVSDDPSTRFTFLYTDYVDLRIDHDPPEVPSLDSSVTNATGAWNQSQTANDGDWRCWSDRVPDDKLGALIEITNMASVGNLDHKVEKAGPLRPTTLDASYDTYTDRISLSWLASSGATGYDIFRMPEAGGWSYLTDVLTNSYDDTGATPGIEYTYRVVAWDGDGFSSYYSNEAVGRRAVPGDIIDPTVTVTSPNGGESWQAGTSHDITWSATDDVGVSYVALEYSVNGGSTWTSIDPDEPDDGTYSWLVPNDPTSSARVRVIAYDAAGNDGSDISDAGFAITPPPDITDPTVTVTSPNGGESWEAGTSHDITWTATDNVGVSYVALEYSVNGGSTWTSIDSSEPNDGTYSWLVPNDPTGTARVRVTAYDAAGNDGDDISDADFAIAPPSGDAYEPDDTWDSANTISDGLPQTHSIVPPDDVDWVTFTLDAESEVLLETSGASGDTRMWLYDSGLTELEYDDNGGTDLFSYIDRLCDVDALPAGTYYVKIDEYGNNNEIPSYDIALIVVQACPGDVGPLEYDGHLVDDDTYNESFGDGDGIVECGESIELWVDMINQGTEAATGVNATISTSDPYVTWLHSTGSDYPDLPGGGTGTNTDDYDFAVGAGAPDGHIIQFDLDITASEGGPWVDSFDVPVSCNNPPDTPSDPMPADGATGVSVTIDLSWTGGDPDAGDTVTYDVYLGTADPPTDLLCDDAASPICDPGTLSYNTLYSWYVVATDSRGESTTGPVWDFTTAGGDAYEPDDTWDLANTISDGLPQTHSIVPPDDVDWVMFTLDAESEVLLETSGVGGDTRMWLYDSGLVELESDDDDGTDLFSYIDRLCDVDALPAGTYYVKIDEYGNNNEIPSYELALTVVQACPGDVGPLEYDSHLVDDDTYNESFGDGDGIVECGESIELWVDLINLGTDGAAGVNATISTGDPYVTWLHNTSSLYPDLPGGGTGTNTDDYDFEVDEDAPHGHIIQFDLDITASEGGPWVDSFDVPVSCNNPPDTPSDPMPADGATGVSVTIDLSWTGGDPDAGDTVTYDVYLGTADPPTDLLCDDAPSPTCDPGTLFYNTLYYWYVVASDNHGASTSGPVWDFTTIGDVGPLEYDSHLVDDDTYNESFGDGDGIVECGESIELWVDLINLGSDAAPGVSATISTGDPYVTWLHNTSSDYPDLPGGGTGTNADDYDFAVGEDAPDGHIIQFDLDITASEGGPWADSFSVPVSCNHPPYTPSDPTPADGALDQDFDVDLAWTGGDPDGDAVTYDVYLGTTDPPTGLVCSGISASVCDPGTLDESQDYFWSVVADDGELQATSPIWQFTIVSVPPTGPTSVIETHGVADDTWQNKVGDPAFTWSGAADVGSGVAGFWVYWGTDPGGTSGAWQTAEAYDPPAVPSPSVYYLRVRTEDNAGNTSPWQTLFTFRYDATAPTGPTSVTEAHGVADNTWQNTVGDPAFTWSGASDVGSGVAGYYVYWGTDPGGASGAWQTAEAYDPPAVPSPSVYYLRVQTEDNAGNASAWLTLFTFRYDASAPSNPTTFSSSHAVDTWSDDNTVYISWSGATDGAGSGVYGYSYEWSTSASTLPDAAVDTAGNSTASPALADSENVYFHIRTRDNVGNWASDAAHHGPFKIDTLAPTNPTSVIEVHGAADDTWQGTVDDPGFTWSGASDAGSGVAGYYVYWGTEPGGTSGTWQVVAGYEPPTVSDPSVYYLRVRTEDNAGNTSPWLTLFTFRYDGSPPSGPITVIETHGVADDTWQNTVGDPAFIWSGASDVGSGVAGYWVYWGTDPGGTSGAWQTTEAFDPSAVLSPSVYYLRVQTEDNAGNTSAWLTLFTFRYDASAPSNPTSFTSSHALDTWSDDNTVYVSWSGASDGTGSGVYGYSFVWTTSSSTLPDAVVDTPNSSTTSPALADNDNWYFHIRTRDNVGNWNSDAAHYGPFKIDATAPAGPTTVTETHGVADDTWQNTVGDPAFTWSGASDAGSGVAGYYVYWGTDPSGTSSVWQTAQAYDPPAVSSPSVYYLRVQTEDDTGNTSAWLTLFTFRYDATAPSNPTAFTSSPVVDTWSGDNTIYISWSGASDGIGSGVYGYSFVWSTSPLAIPDTVADTVGNSTTSAPLADDDNVYFHVRTRDNAGNWNSDAAHYGPFKIDTLAPTGPTSVIETHGVANDTWQAAVGDPAFTWSGASDTGSGVAGYHVYWGTDPSGTSSAWQTSTAYDPLAVPNPSAYYLRVQTQDEAGHTSAWLTLFTFRYDASAPTNPALSSSSHTIGVWSNLNVIDVSWTGASDGMGSGVHGYSYVWSSSPTTLPDTSVDTTANSATSPPLPDSEGWYFHLRTVDNVGNWTPGAVHLGPFRIDTTPPTSSVSALPASQTAIAFPVSWSGTDPGIASGVADYDVQYRVGLGGVWTDWLVGTASTSADFGPINPIHLKDGTTYYFRCRAVDHAGNVEAYPSGDGDTWTTVNMFSTFLPMVLR